MSISTVTPGSIVVPLSEVVAQLQGKLDDAQIETLLAAVLGGRPTQVRPGDPISANLMNQVLFQLSDHALRLARLEAGTTTAPPGQVVIFEPAQGAQLRAADNLQIVGLNFGYSGGRQRVTFDDTPVSGYADGSGDNLLRVVVPTLANLGSGRPVVLSVSNGDSTATRAVTVLPPDQPLTGTVDITAQPSEPSPVAAGANADFPFVLSPRNLNRNADFTLTAALVGQAWNDRIRLLGLLDSTRVVLPNGRVTLSPGQNSTVYVRIAPVPSGTDGQGFSLALSVASGAVSGSSSSTSYTVNQPPDPVDTTLTLTPGNVTPAGVLVGGEIRLAGDDFNDIPVSLGSTAPGGPFQYNLTLELIPETPGGVLATGWTFGFLAPATNPQMGHQAVASNVGNSALLRFNIAVAANGSTTGRLRLHAQRQSAALGRNLEFALRRTS